MIAHLNNVQSVNGEEVKQEGMKNWDNLDGSQGWNREEQTAEHE